MPPKDDDDPASAKEVVTKKQKQLLNREELDLNLIAESLGGVLLEAPATSGRGSGFNLGSILSRIFGGRRGTRNPIDKRYPSGGSGDSGGKGRSGRGRGPLSVSRGTPVGGYGTQPSTPPANAALQQTVDPRILDKYRIKQNYVNPKVKPVSGSGGDAGALARQRLLTKPPVAPTGFKALMQKIGKRTTPGLKQAYAAYRGTERMSKGDYLGAALGYGTGIPGTVGNIAGFADFVRGNPESKLPAIPRDPKQSDAGTSVATAGLPGFKKDTGKPQPDAYGPGPDFSKSDFEARQKELEKLKPKKVKLPSYEEDPSRTAPVGAFNVSPVGSASRKKVEAGIAQAIAARQAQAQPLKVEPFKDTKVTTKDPDLTPKPNQKIDPTLVGAGSQVASRLTRRGRTRRGDDKKPKFGVPSQARGKIGRRQNPQ